MTEISLPRCQMPTLHPDITQPCSAILGSENYENYSWLYMLIADAVAGHQLTLGELIDKIEYARLVLVAHRNGVVAYLRDPVPTWEDAIRLASELFRIMPTVA